MGFYRQSANACRASPGRRGEYIADSEVLNEASHLDLLLRTFDGNRVPRIARRASPGRRGGRRIECRDRHCLLSSRFES
jgi:hypothetical protein